MAQLADREALHKEIDLIQGIINRMANNSFLLKGWLISLVAVILALTKDSIAAKVLSYFGMLLLPVIAFWYLDAFFLHKERCYRKLYEWVIANRNSTNDFLYNLDYTRFKNQVKNTFCIMFSKTTFPFYGTIALVLIIITICRGS
jgi:hypothetical protein